MDGNNIPVTAENREEYVDLYVDWLCNESVKTQFNAFNKGFQRVVADSLITVIRFSSCQC